MLKILYNQSLTTPHPHLNTIKTNVRATDSLEPITCVQVKQCNLNETGRVLYL